MTDPDPRSTVADSAAGVAGTDAEMTLSQEVLHVGTEWTQAGRVRLRRRIVTETRTVEVTVRREELTVETEDIDEISGALVGTRTDGAVADGPQQHEPLVIVLQEEVPEVSVRLRPYERVTVTTTVGSRTEQVGSRVRHEEARLDTDQTTH